MKKLNKLQQENRSAVFVQPSDVTATKRVQKICKEEKDSRQMREKLQNIKKNARILHLTHNNIKNKIFNPKMSKL